MLNQLIKTAALTLPVLAIFGCASVTRPATFGLDPGGAALVTQACTDIMALHTSALEFNACGQSLAEIIRAQRNADRMTQANKRCEQQGLAYGTPELAKCVVLSRRAEAPATSADPAPISVSEAPPNESYFHMSRSQQDERMELSCAHLGLHPASVGFDQCVINLKDAIFYAQNPFPL
jgi:hypothetical protein